MRCMSCGDEMVLADVVPADAIDVQGFEHHTFQCPACDDTECRLVFTDHPTVFIRQESETATISSEPCEVDETVEAPPISNAPPLEAVCDGSTVEPVAPTTEEQPSEDDGVTELADEMAQRSDPPVLEEGAETSASMNVSAPAWVRAVEKLRTYQADLHQRMEESNKTNWNVEFDKSWDSLAVPPRNQLSYAAPLKNLPRSGRERLRPEALTIAGNGSSQSPEPVQELDSEAARPFNEFSHTPQATPLASLPRTPSVAGSEVDDARQAMTGGKYFLNAFGKIISAVQAAVPSRSFF